MTMRRLASIDPEWAYVASRELAGALGFRSIEPGGDNVRELVCRVRKKLVRARWPDNVSSRAGAVLPQAPHWRTLVQRSAERFLTSACLQTEMVDARKPRHRAEERPNRRRKQGVVLQDQARRAEVVYPLPCAHVRSKEGHLCDSQRALPAMPYRIVGWWVEGGGGYRFDPLPGKAK